MENSNLSIFPSLFMSARVLRDKRNNRESYQLRSCASSIDLSENFQRLPITQKCLCEYESVCVSHHIWAKTEGGSPDWSKNFLACSPTERDRKGRNTRKLRLSCMQNGKMCLHTIHHYHYTYSICVPVHVCIYLPYHLSMSTTFVRIATSIYMRLCVIGWRMCPGKTALWNVLAGKSLWAWCSNSLCDHNVRVGVVYLRHSPLMGRGCQTSDHVCPSPLERSPIHLDHLERKRSKCQSVKHQTWDIAILFRWMSALSPLVCSK